MKNISYALGSVLLILATACRSPEEPAQSEISAFQKNNIMGRQLGIAQKNLALTLDDGPGPRSRELAQYLADNCVPTVWFMQGSNIAARIDDVRAIASMKLSNCPASYPNNGKFAHNISSHTWSHININSSSEQTVINQIKQTDAQIIEVRKSQKKANFINFFRAPYGAWHGGAYANTLNATGDLAKYVGPIFWDIGGECSSNYAADWCCWSKGWSVSECRARYIRETEARNGGIILAHDVHSKTVDMLKNEFIPTLRQKGFKFVRLDENPDKIQPLLGDGAKYYNTSPNEVDATKSYAVATVDTVLKHQMKQSSELSAEEKCNLKANERVGIRLREKVSENYARIYVDIPVNNCPKEFFEKPIYIYLPHFNIIKR